LLTHEHFDSKQRRSKQREVIIEELRKLNTHPRSDELYTLVRQRLPNVSLGTIYRNLAKLQREGAALEIYCGDFVRYDGDVAPHDHFLCRVCRRVWDFGDRDGDGETASRLAPGVTVEGFQVEASYTVFTGLCPACLEHNNIEM
jgi:Fur family ferric uptake transcriptional regulator